jgi:hypothetical protein
LGYASRFGEMTLFCYSGAMRVIYHHFPMKKVPARPALARPCAIFEPLPRVRSSRRLDQGTLACLGLAR